ncbi:MAG: WGR domain-containing protein [Oscillospiraceae bacterium]|jgi:predicted DNA-binding WGR domain protein
MKRGFVFKDEKSEKFWTINYSGDSYVVNYGKLGVTGRFDVKELL